MTLDQKRAVALARARQRQAQAQGPTGSDAMRARGLSSPDPSAANAAADPRTGMQKAEGFGRQLIEGAGQGLAGLAGIPGSIVNLEADLLGSDFRLPTGQQGMQAAASAVTGDTHPINSTERRARAVGEYAAPSVATGAMGGIPGMLASGASGVASGLAAGEVREQGGGAVMEAIASVLAGGLPLAVGGAASKALQTRKAVNAVPSVDDLKGTAGGLYDAGEATGKTAARGYTQKLADTIKGIAADEGMVLPSGETMTTSYPKVAAAMRMVDEYAGQKMTPEQMRQVRRVVQDAAQSADAAEARIGSKMIKELDKFVDPLVPEFGEANRTYARAMRGQEIEEATEIATQGRRSSPEVAISNEFQNLTRKGIRGDLTYPPELDAAVRHAANGSRTRQVAAGIGNLAPTANNMVRAGLGLGSAATAGATLGGPAGAAAAVVGGGGAGLIARLLANNLAKGDARMASAIARNGGALPEAQMPESVKAAIAALLASQAAQ